MAWKLLIIAILLFALASSNVLAVVYVKWDSPGPTFDGTSWETAFHKVQDGLNASSSGDEVWVAKGTYVERITLKDGVALYGGFAGTETSREQRNWNANPTILDANQSQIAVHSPPGATRATRIDGFTIRNAYFTNLIGTAAYWVSGGGISCDSSSPTIANNIITGNYADSGGGIGCFEGSSPLIVNNTIVGNSAMEGGGILCDGASPTIANNIMVQNAAFVGGAILCFDSSPIIAGNTIAANSAELGGGVYCDIESSPAISNNIIAFNSSGICNGFYDPGTPVLRSNCVYGNTSEDYSGLEPGIGDISADPLLACREYRNIHIQPGSPCIDAGDDSEVDPAWVDIDHQPRIQGTHADIGADESDGTDWPAGPYAIIRVSASGDDASDGSTWPLAKKTVQAGVYAAAAVGGDVWVQAGTYHECLDLYPYAYVYGGFAGTESAREQRNWAANRTILDGQGKGPIVTITIGDRVSAIDGFTIRNGFGYANETGRHAGGIHCFYPSSSTIANNTITGNHGDAIYCDSSSQTISNNVIAQNSGAGIFCGSSSIVTNNTVTDNGGMGVSCSSSTMVSNNIVAFNASGIYNSGGSPVLRNNCVYGNTDYNYSGISAGTGDISADPILVGRKYGDLHIQPESPCVDAGWSSAPGLPATDMDGQARAQGGAVDIGADESDGTTWPPSGPHAIVRVSPSGDDANDGSSWSLAKKTVQSAIDAASVQSGEVWVQAGTYDERITLHPYAYVYGGFAGTESTVSERNWTANKTVLDGGAGGSVVTIKIGYQVSTIDGFTIRNGTGTKVGSYTWGGGIYCFNGTTPTIANNTITGNSASSDGGGIACRDSSSPTISNNTITANSAYCGGGLACDYSSSPTVADNTISENKATEGGGVYCYNQCVPSITANTITGNSATYGGGVYCEDRCSPSIADNTLTANSASYGGGICCRVSSSPVIAGNALAENRATKGGAVYCAHSLPTITENTVASNVGGGIYCESNSSPTIMNNTIVRNIGGGIHCENNSSSTIMNNTIVRNIDGGGISLYYSSATIANNVIVQNMTTSRGGGIYCLGSSPIIASNTIAQNSAANGGGICCFHSSPTVMNNILALNHSGIYSEGGTPTVSSNCLYGNALYDYSGIPAGDGDISADPLFASKGSGNFHIQPGSPCIDAGDDGAVSLEWHDIDGQPRIQGDHVDMGADESDGTDWPVVHDVIVRVSTSGDDANDGSSWQSPKRTVQAAIEAASTFGGEVWVKAGTYEETVVLHPYCYLYGGFAGTESGRTERDWMLNTTILDGGGAGSVVLVRGGHEVSTIDGFTVRDGSTCGISCSYASPTICNNTVIGNGSGISCVSSEPTIWNNSITDNRGRGITCSSSSPSITRNMISSNSGGGILCSGILASSSITGNTIIGNTTSDAGGGICCIECSPTISNNSITGNSGKRGGGIHCNASSPILSNNTIADNSAYGGGGVFCVESSSPTITNNTITGNDAPYGGGIFSYKSCAPTISNSILAFNSSGIYSVGGTPLLRNNDVYCNTDYDYFGIPAGLGDISIDPLFVNLANGDYHLKLISPCVNAGWNEALGLPETEMDGENRILYGTVDIGADECSGTASVLKEAKMVANSVPVLLTDVIVTGAFEGYFYIEAEDRSCGVRVEKPAHGVQAGDKVNVTGALKTNADGERYIEATLVEVTGTGRIAPLHINTRAIGGGNWFYNPTTGAGQCGVVGGLGLNNIGLLVTTWGKVSYLNGTYALDLDTDKTAKILLEGLGLAGKDTYVRITGIVSCYREADGLYPTILATEIIPLY